VTGLELGKAHVDLGELVEAREVFLSVARIPIASDETDKSARSRAEAAELADQLQPRIATLVVTVTGSPNDDGVRVSVDDVTTPLVAHVSVRRTNPGPHTVVVGAGDRARKEVITVAEGETKNVTLAVPPAPEPAAAPPPARREITKLTWAALGVGAAGLALGGVAGGLAIGKAHDVDRQCEGLHCLPSAKEAVDDGRTWATLSTIGFAVAAAGLVTAAVVYFALPRHTKQARFGGLLDASF